MSRKVVLILLFTCVTMGAEETPTSIPPNYSAYTLNPLYTENPTLGWAQERIEEKLARGMVAVPSGQGKVYLGWRLLKSDPEGIAFNVYRSTAGGNAVKLNAEPLRKTTDFVDAKAPLDRENAWWVRPVLSGKEQEASGRAVLPANPPEQQYISFKLRDDIIGSWNSQDWHRRPGRRRGIRFRHKAPGWGAWTRAGHAEVRTPSKWRVTKATAPSCGARTWAGRLSWAPGTRQ